MYDNEKVQVSWDASVGGPEELFLSIYRIACLVNTMACCGSDNDCPERIIFLAVATAVAWLQMITYPIDQTSIAVV